MNDFTGFVDFKMPPSAPEIEGLVLGAIMQEKDCLDESMPLLHTDIFYKEEHRQIFQVINDMYRFKKGIDIVTITLELRAVNKLETIGGAHYISTLTSNISSTSNTEYHIRILTQLFLKREQIRIFDKAIQTAYSQSDVFDDISTIENEISRLNSYVIGNSFENDIAKKIHTRYVYNTTQREKWLTGVPSGFSKIDAVTRGFQKSDLILLAARPSMGKTAFAISLALHAARSGYKVPFFSFEMTENPIYDRALQNISELDWNTVAHQAWSESELSRYTEAAEIIARSGLYLNDQPGNANYVKTVLRERQKKYGVDMAIVDYIQLMPPVAKSKSREEDVSEIGKALKNIAKELNIPIIAISTMNRMSESRINKRPVLGDLREGGALEYHADLVLSLYRPSYYHDLAKDKDYNKKGLSEDEYNSLVEINIMKHRNGAIGEIDGYFFADKSLFKEKYNENTF